MLLELKKIRAIVFDFDGTLYDFKKLPFRMVMARFWDINRIKRVQSVRQELKGIDFGTAEQYYQKLFSCLACPPFFSEDKASSWYSTVYIRHMTKILKQFYQCHDGVVPLLNRLRAAGIRTAVFSDYASLSERLAAVGLSEDLFDVCVEAESAGALKPAVRPFIEIANTLDVPSEQVLVVGDRSDTDGAGAVAAGMHFIQIRTHKTKADETSAISWSDFLHIAAMFQSVTEVITT